jgi:hypothetical protein
LEKRATMITGHCQIDVARVTHSGDLAAKSGSLPGPLLRPGVFKTRHDPLGNFADASLGIYPYNVGLACPSGQQRGLLSEFLNAPVDNLRLVVCPATGKHSFPDHIVWRVKHHYHSLR